MAAFATFAVGYFSRPIGGVLIAHFGDRFGRKPALILTIVLMGLSTIGMGLLPTYEHVGLLAPILLVLCRVLQGFGAGAEYAGALTLVSEYVPPERKAYYTSFLAAATVAGIMMATMLFLVVSYLPEETLFSWAWRVPFLLSAVLLIVALYIRRSLDETPEYVAAMEKAEERRRKRLCLLVSSCERAPRKSSSDFCR